MPTKLELALEIAAKALRRRALFEEEIAGKLRDEGFAEDTVSAAVSRLRELGYLNDDAQAGDFAERSELGAGRIRSELERRGASGEAIEKAIGSLPADREVSAAVQALSHRFRHTKARNPFKMGRYLYQRGFDEETIETAIQRFLEEDESSHA
jgi:SOS response regulatory protein OraA/RecX